MVVAGDGVYSFLVQQAGIRAKQLTKHLAVGVKLVVGLPRPCPEDRFRLVGNEGVADAVVGDCTCAVVGGGFLYTNLDSVLVGVVLQLADLTEKGLTSVRVHDHFLSHPAIARCSSPAVSCSSTAAT